MKMKWLGFIAIFLLVLATVVSAQNGPHDLKYKFQVAGPLKYKMGENGWKSTKMGDYPAIEIQTFFEIDFSARLGEIEEEGRFPVLMSFETLDITTRTGGQTHYPNVDMVKGKSMSTVISGKGKVQETIGKELLPQVQLVPVDPTAFNFGDIFNQFFVELPDHAVGVGDKWTITDIDTTDQMGTTLINESEGSYTFSKMTERGGYQCVLIKGKIKMKLNQKGQTMGSNFSFEGKGKGKVQYYFAINEGILVYSKVSMSIDGDIELTGQQKIDGLLSQNSEVTYKLIQ